MIKPIHRIPRDSELTLTTIIRAEGDPTMSIAETLVDASNHTMKYTTGTYDPLDDDHLRVMLDWAAQLRLETGLDWNECISTAMTMYFG